MAKQERKSITIQIIQWLIVYKLLIITLLILTNNESFASPINMSHNELSNTKQPTPSTMKIRAINTCILQNASFEHAFIHSFGYAESHFFDSMDDAINASMYYNKSMDAILDQTHSQIDRETNAMNNALTIIPNQSNDTSSQQPMIRPLKCANMTIMSSCTRQRTSNKRPKQWSAANMEWNMTMNTISERETKNAMDIIANIESIKASPSLTIKPTTDRNIESANYLKMKSRLKTAVYPITQSMSSQTMQYCNEWNQILKRTKCDRMSLLLLWLAVIGTTICLWKLFFESLFILKVRVMNGCNLCINAWTDWNIDSTLYQTEKLLLRAMIKVTTAHTFKYCMEWIISTKKAMSANVNLLKMMMDVIGYSKVLCFDCLDYNALDVQTCVAMKDKTISKGMISETVVFMNEDRIKCKEKMEKAFDTGSVHWIYGAIM